MASSLCGESGASRGGLSLFWDDVAWFFLSLSGEPESDRSASSATASRPSRSMSYAYGSPLLPCFEKDWSMSISSSSIAVGAGGHACWSIVFGRVTLGCYFGFPGERVALPRFPAVPQPFPVVLALPGARRNAGARTSSVDRLRPPEATSPTTQASSETEGPAPSSEQQLIDRSC